MKIGYFLSCEEYTPAELVEQAVALIRRLWEGDFVTSRGRHYEVSNARIYTRPASPPPIYVSGFGPKAVDDLSRFADGFMSTSPDGELSQVLPSVRHIEQASSLVTRESTAGSVVAGPDISKHLDQLHEYRDAGFDEVYVADMGPHFREMIEAYGRDVLPTLRSER